MLDFLYVQNYEDGYNAVDHLEFFEEKNLLAMRAGKTTCQK